ncbi:MAG: lysophospholipid acyltransferase family protein [Bacteroidota bacterium]
MIVFRWLHTIYATILFVLTFLIVFPGFVILAQKKEWHITAYKLTHIWGVVLYKLVGLRVMIEDKNKGEWTKPCIYVANHFSYSDIASMPLITNDACFVGKESISKAPLFGYYFRALHITVNRKSLRDRGKVVGKTIEAIEAGKSLFIFPEGGIRSTNPPYQTPYKDGAFRTAITTGVPVVPVSLPYNWLLMPDDGSMLLRGNKIKIVIHEAISTENMTEEDIPELKKKVFNLIENELIKHNTDKIKEKKVEAI